MIIDTFREQYAFLSNFYIYPFYAGGKQWQTSEHLFQALKTTIPSEREWVRQAPTPAEAKSRGRRVTLRSDWNDIRLNVMRYCLKVKFDSPLGQKLKATGDAILVEGNTWRDTYWGMCNGVGENHLGKLLMELRDTLA
jgi:hypothetical protein